ncbi:hypothetical protein QR680_008206 [Steinernema hermaphroditum]|uniref:Uncharacterized protein n=1 Tax=Steinernema hermaphroditum TaxID=289476 RepID=A0AA39II43_9BILA|nr:hypothetical protein QR680_008206 [Steinernema hermaphroditum]
MNPARKKTGATDRESVSEIAEHSRLISRVITSTPLSTHRNSTLQINDITPIQSRTPARRSRLRSISFTLSEESSGQASVKSSKSSKSKNPSATKGPVTRSRAKKLGLKLLTYEDVPRRRTQPKSSKAKK